MRLPSLLRSPLALRIYLVGLIQVAIVAAGLWTIVWVNRPPPPRPPGALAEQILDRLQPLGTDAAKLEVELAAIAEEEGADVAVVDAAGRSIATTPGAEGLRCPERRPHGGPRRGRPHDQHARRLEDAPPVGAAPAARTRPAGPPCLILELDETSGALVHVLGPTPPTPPSLAPRIVPMVLIVVGVASLLLAWTLTRPLRKMSAAARALGSGDLGARVRLRRRDELGEVATAFDEMAERISVLLKSEKELIANVSHELRTPLARIRVALDLAAEGDADTAREAITDIAGDLDELERLLSDVLTAARLDLADGHSVSALPPLRREAVKADQLIADAAARFAIVHPQRRLTVDSSELGVVLHGDKVLLRRVIENLLTNAHKYTEDQAEPVVLRAAATGETLRIEVVDRGIGIEEDDLGRVFRPFFRADKSRTKATGGLGLGLALAKRIVDAHDGTIEIDSRPGEGTRVRVALPATRG